MKNALQHSTSGLLLFALAFCLNLGLQAETRVVSNANDSGPGSLRELVANAAAFDSIRFAPELAGDTIVLTTGEIFAGVPLTIDASDLSDTLTISGNDSSRIFRIEYFPEEYGDSTFFSVHGIRFVNGHSEEAGGAVLSLARTRFNSCAFLNNSARSGGAAYCSSVQFENCTFQSNMALASGGAVCQFAYIASFMYLNCSFLSNTALLDGGAIAIFGSGGDPIDPTHVLRFDLLNCILVRNSAVKNGGGIAIDGPYPGINAVNSIFFENTAEEGGGIACSEYFRANNCLIAYNSASKSGGGFRGVGSFFNTIIADNNAGETGMDVQTLTNRSINSGGGNIISRADSATGWLDTDSLGSIAAPLDPMLEAFVWNGDTLYRPQANSFARGFGLDRRSEYICLDITGNRRYANCVDAGAVQVSDCGGPLAGLGRCWPVGVAPLQTRAAAPLRAFPSPTSGRLRVEFAPALLAAELTILDATGRAALRQSVPAGEGGVDLDLSALPSGVYAVILNGGRGPQVARVVKE